MLNRIFGSLVYDIGLCLDGFVGYDSLPGSLLISGSTDLVSAYAKKEPVFQKQYDVLYASVE